MPSPEKERRLITVLRRAIQDSGHSLYQLGKLSGVGPDRLSRFVRGQRTLTLTAAEKLCETLGLTLTEDRPGRPRRRPKPKPGQSPV